MMTTTIIDRQAMATRRERRQAERARITNRLRVLDDEDRAESAVFKAIVEESDQRRRAKRAATLTQMLTPIADEADAVFEHLVDLERAETVRVAEQDKRLFWEMRRECRRLEMEAFLEKQRVKRVAREDEAQRRQESAARAVTLDEERRQKRVLAQEEREAAAAIAEAARVARMDDDSARRQDARRISGRQTEFEAEQEDLAALEVLRQAELLSQTHTSTRSTVRANPATKGKPYSMIGGRL